MESTQNAIELVSKHSTKVSDKAPKMDKIVKKIEVKKEGKRYGFYRKR